MKRGLTVVVIIWLLLSTVCAWGVPSSISYQGKLTDSRGRPLPDGKYAVAIGLFTSETATKPVWSSDKLPVETTGGVFIAAFAPPHEVFDKYTDLWLATSVDGEQLYPRTKLHAAPFAVHAAAADSVPDGSITSVKLAADVVFARAPYLTGLESGLPATLRLKVLVDNVEETIPPVLSSPYTENVEVVEYPDPVDPEYRWLRKRPGRVRSQSLILRRPLTNDKTWFNRAFDPIDSQLTRTTYVLALTNGTQELCRWTALRCWISSYTVRLADDGLPVEEIQVVHEGPLQFSVAAPTGQNPSGSGTQLGFTSGQPSGTQYVVKLNGVAQPNLVVAADNGWNTEVIEYLDGEDMTVRKRPGRSYVADLKLRANPTQAPDIYNWYKSVTDGLVERKTVELSLVTPAGSTNIVRYINAWPCSFTLAIGDDGQPIAEYTITSEEAVTPQ